MCPGTSLVVRELRLHTLNAGGTDSIPSQGIGSHMLQLSHTSKDPTCHSQDLAHQINTYLKKKMCSTEKLA